MNVTKITGNVTDLFNTEIASLCYLVDEVLTVNNSVSLFNGTSSITYTFDFKNETINGSKDPVTIVTSDDVILKITIKNNLFQVHIKNIVKNLMMLKCITKKTDKETKTCLLLII